MFLNSGKVTAVPLTDHIVIFIDCQTTSPNPTNGNLLEISWSLGNASGERFNEQSYLIKQPDDKPVPYRIKSITGISDADMEVAIPIEEARLRLLDTISCLPEPRYCIAHFARFELPFCYRYSTVQPAPLTYWQVLRQESAESSNK